MIWTLIILWYSAGLCAAALGYKWSGMLSSPIILFCMGFVSLILVSIFMFIEWVQEQISLTELKNYNNQYWWKK